MPRMLRISTSPPSSALLRSRDTCASRVLDSISSSNHKSPRSGARCDNAVPSHQQRAEIKASRRRNRTLLSATMASLVPTRQFAFPNDRTDGTRSRWPPQHRPHPGDESSAQRACRDKSSAPQFRPSITSSLVSWRSGMMMAAFPAIGSRLTMSSASRQAAPVDDRQIVLEIAERLLASRNDAQCRTIPCNCPSKRPR